MFLEKKNNLWLEDSNPRWCVKGSLYRCVLFLFKRDVEALDLALYLIGEVELKTLGQDSIEKTTLGLG